MGYPAKIQQITRKDFNQYYINFPRSIAMAMNFNKGDVVEWEIADKDTLILKRKEVELAGQKRV
jgi:bifunctional DNA-binding transcriptional regulator/antitoxin component of YhaV-PrlF toxin-antitoxin module